MHKTTLALAALMIMPNALRSEICELYAEIQYEDDSVKQITLASDYGEPDRVFITMDRPTEQEILSAHRIFGIDGKRRAVCLEQDVGYECIVLEPEYNVTFDRYRIRDDQMVVTLGLNSILPRRPDMIFNCD